MEQYLTFDEVEILVNNVTGWRKSISNGYNGTIEGLSISVDHPNFGWREIRVENKENWPEICLANYRTYSSATTQEQRDQNDRILAIYGQVIRSCEKNEQLAKNKVIDVAKSLVKRLTE